MGREENDGVRHFLGRDHPVERRAFAEAASGRRGGLHIAQVTPVRHASKARTS
jgi:hypothetical protein